MKTEKFIEMEKILQEAGIEYTIHANLYLTIDKDEREFIEGLDSDIFSENDPHLVLIAPDGFKDGEDMDSALNFCGLYCGQ